MGLSLITAMEIFTNPEDLRITVEQEKEGTGFAFGIFRGPGHDFKPMITSQPFAETQGGAISVVEEILRTAYDVVSKEFANPEGIVSTFLNPDNKEVDQLGFLNPELIDWIIDQLLQHQVANTYERLATSD